MILGAACGLLLLAILGPCASVGKPVLINGEELETLQEDPGTRKIGFGQALGYHSNNKINTIDAANQAAKDKFFKDLNKMFSKHFGTQGKRSVSIPSSETQNDYSKKWTNEFGKLFGGQKLTEGDYSLLGAVERQQGDSKRPDSRLLQQLNKAYEKYFGKKESKFNKQWTEKYNRFFG